MDTLKENVNHSRLYHFTDAKTALKIIQDDALLVGGNYVFNTDKGKCICLSRSFNFIKSRINKGSVIFVLNKDLLQTKYKIVPISDTKNMTNKRARFATDSKAEELVFSDITNLHKYIDRILVTDEVYNIYKKRIPEINITKISDYKINEDVNMDNDIKITSREKGLQILYWLEDKGIDANFSQWNENSYYFNFNDERDYNNALILLYEYCGKDSIRYDDYSRMEIELDVDKAYPRLKDNVNSKYMSESVNEEINDEDSITEELLESDNVEDDLEDLIRDTIEENKNENSKISLFEITTEPENPTRAKDEEEMYVVDFDDMKTDFRKLTIYPYDEENPHAPVASFMLSGGLNGSGNWTDYLDDLQELFKKLKEATGLEPLVYEESTDIIDDVWDAKVFMYDHSKDDEDEDDYSLNEDLFHPNKLNYTFKVGDTITTPQNYDELLGGALSENCCYRIIKTRDGKYDIWYKDLETYSNPNISGGEGTFAEFDGSTFDSLEELSQTLLQLEPNLTMEMINRPNPRRSYSLTIEHNPELEKLLNFWNTNNIANYKINWLNSNRIRTVDVYGDKTPEIWQVNPNKSLKLINSLNNQVVNEWSSVEEYISEFEEDNRDLDDEDLNEDIIDETYSKKELEKLKNKVFNQRKIMSIYKKRKYGKQRLMCRTKCVNCGREKKLFLSNLVTNPEKYGSCICSDKNIDARYDTINGLYKGTKKLRSNTSGYTGVSWVSTYGGEPYNKWRAYIDIDGHRNYLGDFSSKSKAIRARKAAAAKGIKWYSENKNQFMATSRRKRKRHRNYKTKKSTANS